MDQEWVLPVSNLLVDPSRAAETEPLPGLRACDQLPASIPGPLLGRKGPHHRLHLGEQPIQGPAHCKEGVRLAGIR
jgi:hypothetical protein